MELQISSDTSRLHFGFHQKQVNLVGCQSKQSIFTTLFFPVLNLFFERDWGLTRWVSHPHGSDPTAQRLCAHAVQLSNPVHCCEAHSEARCLSPHSCYAPCEAQSMRSPGSSCPGISCGIFCSSVPKSLHLQPAVLCANELG